MAPDRNLDRHTVLQIVPAVLRFRLPRNLELTCLRCRSFLRRALFATDPIRSKRAIRELGHRHVDHEVATSSRYGDDHRVISQARLGRAPRRKISAKCLSSRSRSFPDSAACHPKCHRASSGWYSLTRHSQARAFGPRRLPGPCIEMRSSCLVRPVLYGELPAHGSPLP
jgi:hypothetical protein